MQTRRSVFIVTQSVILHVTLLTLLVFQAMQFYNRLVKSAVAALCESKGVHSTVRLFEIGGGTGATTAQILPALPPECSQYWFTDLSETFLLRAKERWQRMFPFIRYGIFNAESDPVMQGFGAHQFDAVIAVNVLHATSDLRQTLLHTHRLLRPGGMLVLSEMTEVHHTAVADITWGLTEGWWLFDDGRAFAPQSRDQWRQWFDATGFSAGAIQPILPHVQALEGQTVFTAFSRWPESMGQVPSCQAEAMAEQTILVTGGMGGVGLATAQWLLESCGVCAIVLTSRKGTVKDENELQKLQMLQNGGQLAVSCAACDTTQLHSTQSLIQHTARLGGVIQSVGVLADALIENQALPAFQKVISPKVDGAGHLHGLAQQMALTCFIVYSSIAGLVGPPGQAPHAAANSSLDSFIQWRRSAGHAAMGFQWGAWSTIGYAARVGADTRSNQGAIRSFTPQAGLSVLQSAWKSISPSVLMVAYIVQETDSTLPSTRCLTQGLVHTIRWQGRLVQQAERLSKDDDLQQVPSNAHTA